MTFELHPNLAKKTFIIDLPLSRVLLEDEKNYPWIFLVPRRPQVLRMMDLNSADQHVLMQEINQAENILWKLFQPTQLNVAAIGNKTPQLHVHVLARRAEDPAWPGTVWDHPVRSRYTSEAKDQMIEKLRFEFTS